MTALALLLIGPLGIGAAPAAYGVARTGASREALLAAGQDAWRGAARIAWGPTGYETGFHALWDDLGLYVLFEATDPDPWHTMSNRDDEIWNEEVVELFIDLDRTGRDYYELEVSPANVVCDLRMAAPWPDKEGDVHWDLEGLQTRVHLRTDVEERTTGWTATAFLPWAGFATLPSARSVHLPPKPGDTWRFNVFRIKRPGGPLEPEKDAVFAAWSPPSGPSFHDAGAFRPFVFEAGP